MMQTDQQMTKSIAIVNASGPLSTNGGKDSLDAALIYGSYEQPVSLFFHADGVFQLIQGNNLSSVEQKNYLKTFEALTFYDIEHIYCCGQSLAQRGLEQDFAIEDVQVINIDDFAAKLAEHQIILRF